MAAAILTKEAVLDNVPDIADIGKLIAILKEMGVNISREGHRVFINTRTLSGRDPDPDLVRTIRASYILIGPMLARYGKVSIPHPGGCVIGARPIDLHVQAFRDLGAEVQTQDDIYHFKFTKLANRRVKFPSISVGATENILIFAANIPEEIIIENAALEPGVVDLADFLRAAGAKIKFSDRTIRIVGTKNLNPVTHTVIPDRTEAGTYAILAATTQSNLEITNIRADHLDALFQKFKEIGVQFAIKNDTLYIKESSNLRATEISTSPYPGFPTDLQSPMGVLLTQATGKSILKENIFENRLGYLDELEKMGAKVRLLNNREAEISGPSKLQAAKIESLDLRAGATLIIAALAAEGTSEISEAETIDRGYEKIEERLSKIGAQIKRI